MAVAKLDTIGQVRDIMLDLLDFDDLQIDDATTAADVDGWDSLIHIRMIVAIERRFKIRFATSEVEGLKNVGDLVRMIDRKLGS